MLLKARRPDNNAERIFYEAANENGYSVFRAGWPDFMIERDNRIAFVEVKPNKKRPLKTNQKQIMELLAGNGFDCYKWTPDGGFEKIRPTGKHYGNQKHMIQPKSHRGVVIKA